MQVNFDEIIFNQSYAKALWGEEQLVVEHSHVTLSIQPGYTSTLNDLKNSADIRMEQEHDYKCFSCGRVLGGNYWVNNEVCWTDGTYNAGWQYHLQQMVVSEDPLKYLTTNLPVA